MASTLIPDLPTITKTGFAKQLIDWFNLQGRDLPWRHTHDPYHIWLSEVMLQQTQVKTVIDYYHRFLTLFPTIEDLAKAQSDTVLKAWEGLGYYARCRNLHQTAKIISNEYGGQFPNSIEAVEALPGIGKSTAGAILTFSYGQAHPLLDGNVKRVLSRLFDIEDDIAKPSLQPSLWQYSTQLLEESIGIEKGPWAFDQGIMELGATVCVPKDPRCLVCPVHQHCDAFANGTQHERPNKTKKAPTPHYHIGVGILWDESQKRVFIQQRPPEGLLGGLWEFPGGKQEPNEALEETVRREFKEELDIDITVGEKLISVKHAYTHFKTTLHAYHCYLPSPQEPKLNAATASQWVTMKQITKFAFPKGNKKILECLLSL